MYIQRHLGLPSGRELVRTRSPSSSLLPSPPPSLKAHWHCTSVRHLRCACEAQPFHWSVFCPVGCSRQPSTQLVPPSLPSHNTAVSCTNSANFFQAAPNSIIANSVLPPVMTSCLPSKRSSQGAPPTQLQNNSDPTLQ